MHRIELFRFRPRLWERPIAYVSGSLGVSWARPQLAEAGNRSSNRMATCPHLGAPINWAVPAHPGVPDGQIQQLGGRFVARDVAPRLDDRAQRSAQALQGVCNRYEDVGAAVLVMVPESVTYGATIRDKWHRGPEGAGRSVHTMSCELVFVAGRLCDSPGCAESADP